MKTREGRATLARRTIIERVLLGLASVSLISIPFLSSAAPGAQADPVATLLNKYRQVPSDDIDLSLIRPRMLSWEYLSNFREIARLHVEFDSWNEPLKINEIYNGHGTYLYITKPSVSDKLPAEFRGNCTALQNTKVILCDGSFLTNIARCLQDPGVTIEGDGHTDPETQRTIVGLMYFKARALLSWVIGHEIGHLAKGHVQSPTHKSWSLPNSTGNLIIGNRAEIEADEYSFRSMFRGRDESTIPFMTFFPQTIGLLAWHMQYDDGKKVYYSPLGHPPMAARLYNAWSLYKRDYDLADGMNSDDKHVVSNIRNVDWVSSSSVSNSFCQDSKSRKYRYPMLRGSDSADREMLRALLKGWIYRERAWSADVLSEIKSVSGRPSNWILSNQKFLEAIEAINELVFAEEGETKKLSERVLDIARNGLPGERKSVSLFAQALASSAYHGKMFASDVSSDASEKIKKAFDASRLALAKLQIGDADEPSRLALSELPILLLFHPDTLGSETWTKVIRQITAKGQSDPATIETLVNYIVHWVESPRFFRATGRENPHFVQEWNAVDTLYVASHLGSYENYAAHYRSIEAALATRMQDIEPQNAWMIYYDAAHRFVLRAPDRAFEMASEALSALEKNDGLHTSRLPALPNKWKIEQEIRFRNLLGWILTQRKDFATAVSMLTPAEQPAREGCLWVRSNERCRSNQHPDLVYIWDNLAEANLGIGNIERARHYAAMAQSYRDEAAKEPDFKGFDASVLFSSAKVWAAIQLLGNEEQRKRGVEFIGEINELAVKQMFPQRPSRGMFLVTVEGRPVDLIAKLPAKPAWLKHIDEIVEATQVQ